MVNVLACIIYVAIAIISCSEPIKINADVTPITMVVFYVSVSVPTYVQILQRFGWEMEIFHW